MHVKIMVCMLPVAWILLICAVVLTQKLFGGFPFPIPLCLGVTIFMWLPAFAAWAAFSTYFERQRRRQLQELAGKFGLRYRTAGRFVISHRYDFELFDYGRRYPASQPGADHCLYGRYEHLPITLFDCSYRFGRSESEVSVLLARLDFRAPHLIIRPQKVTRHLSEEMRGLDTESLEPRTSPERILDPRPSSSELDCIYFPAEEFRRVFHVRCDQENFALEICHATMREFLLHNQSICWELSGKYLLLHRARRQWSSPQELECYLRLAREFVARIPQQVRTPYQALRAGL